MTAKTAALALVLATGATLASSQASAQYHDPWKVEYPHIEFGLDVGVMLWNGVDRNVVRPGGTVDVRFGWDYKWWVPMLALGFRGNGIYWTPW